MIENKNDASRNLEKALQALEQAKQRVANEKKKQNEKKRKAENHHKYIMHLFYVQKEEHERQHSDQYHRAINALFTKED